MNTDHQPKIALDGLVAGRLTFKDGDREIIYDSRGYKFAHCPTTGDSLTEPKESARSHCDTGCFFGAYDDCGYGKFFSFWEEDCFGPPQYLICAKSFEDAYDIFLDEFGTALDQNEITEILAGLSSEECKNRGLSEYDTLNDDLKREIDEAAQNRMGEDGTVTTRPNGGEWVWCESVQGHELKLVKIELVEES